MFAVRLMMFHWHYVTSKILLDCSQKNQDKAFRTNSLRMAFADARLQCSAKFSDGSNMTSSVFGSKIVSV